MWALIFSLSLFNAEAANKEFRCANFNDEDMTKFSQSLALLIKPLENPNCSQGQVLVENGVKTSKTNFICTTYTRGTRTTQIFQLDGDILYGKWRVVSVSHEKQMTSDQNNPPNNTPPNGIPGVNK